MILLSSAALATEALALGEELPEPEASFRVEVGGRLGATYPTSGVSRGFSLPRGRLVGQVLGPHGVSARVATVLSRSGGETGYIGIEGEALVPRLQLAEARIDLPSTGLAVAAGVIDDLWVGVEQPAWEIPGIAPEIGNATGLQVRADLGGWLAWSAPDRVVTATVSLTDGEGELRRDRNNGVNFSALLTARRPLAEDAELYLRLYGQEGSRGVLKARNHRLGSAAGLDHPYVDAGLQVLAGWGRDADGSLLPLATGAWVRSGHALPVVAWARGDLAWAQRGDADTLTSWVRIGVGPKLPLKGDAPAWIGVGWEGVRHGAQAGPVAGVVSGSDQVFVQLNVDVTARVKLKEEG